MTKTFSIVLLQIIACFWFAIVKNRELEFKRKALYRLRICWPGSLFHWVPSPVARSDARPSGIRTVAGSILGSGNILSWRLVMKPFQGSLPLTGVGQLSATALSTGHDHSCWLGRKTTNQTKQNYSTGPLFWYTCTLRVNATKLLGSTVIKLKSWVITKSVVCHMRSSAAQISLHFLAVWSAALLVAT